MRPDIASLWCVQFHTDHSYVTLAEEEDRAYLITTLEKAADHNLRRFAGDDKLPEWIILGVFETQEEAVSFTNVCKQEKRRVARMLKRGGSSI